MGIFGQEYELSQMKEYFENQIPNIRIISDLNLTENDFKHLGTKLKCAFPDAECKDGIEEIILCYLVYWVYALIYWDEEKGIHDELTDYFAQLPQYQIRHHFQSLVDTFADYGINDFGYKLDSVEEQCSMLIARHAGIPDMEKYEVFELLDDYRKHDIPVDAMVADIYLKLPYRSQYIFSLLDNSSRRDMIWEIRTVMAVVCLKMYTREELLTKYPRVSIRLLDCCFDWQETRKTR